METLPVWFWSIYYFFILGTLVMSLISIFRKRNAILSAITFLFSIIAPVIVFGIAIGRPSGSNEISFIFSEAISGNFWAIFVIFVFCEMLFWWIKKLYSDICNKHSSNS